MTETPHTADADEPRRIGDIIGSPDDHQFIGDVTDPERAKAVQERDLTSEVDGLQTEREALVEESTLTGDPALDAHIDAATHAQVEASADLGDVRRGDNTSGQ